MQLRDFFFFGILVVSLLLLRFVSDAVVAAERFEPTSVLAELFVYFLLCLCSMLNWNWKRPLCVNSCLLAGPGRYIREGLSINAQLYSVAHGPMLHRFRLMNKIGCGRQCNDASSHYFACCLLLFAMLISFCVCVCVSLGKQIAAVWPLICHPLGFRRLSPK